AGLAGVEVVERTRVGRPEEHVHGVVPQFDRAASEAIASGRNVRRAGVQACLGLRLHARARVALPIPAADVRARVLGIAAQVPRAAVVALAAVAVEEAILFAIDVVAGDPGA